MLLIMLYKRINQAENRGVKQGGAGGKLSKQLAEQKRQNPMQAESSELPERMVVSMAYVGLCHSNLTYILL